jgi:hypothetical protein
MDKKLFWAKKAKQFARAKDPGQCLVKNMISAIYRFRHIYLGLTWQWQIFIKTLDSGVEGKIVFNGFTKSRKAAAIIVSP